MDTWAPACALIFRDWDKITPPTRPGQFEFELLPSQMTKYAGYMGTCIIDWFLGARDKIRKPDPQKYRIPREQANFRTHFNATAHL